MWEILWIHFRQFPGNDMFIGIRLMSTALDSRQKRRKDILTTKVCVKDFHVLDAFVVVVVVVAWRVCMMCDCRERKRKLKVIPREERENQYFSIILSYCWLEYVVIYNFEDSCERESPAVLCPHHEWWKSVREKDKLGGNEEKGPFDQDNVMQSGRRTAETTKELRQRISRVVSDEIVYPLDIRYQGLDKMYGLVRTENVKRSEKTHHSWSHVIIIIIISPFLSHISGILGTDHDERKRGSLSFRCESKGSERKRNNRYHRIVLAQTSTMTTSSYTLLSTSDIEKDIRRSKNGLK